MRLILPALAALALGACAGTADSPPAGASSGSPLPQRGYDWFFHEDGGTLQLAYGVAESDDVPVSLSCERAAGRIELLVPAPDGAAAEIHLESGGETERFPAESEPSQLDDGVYLTAQADADEPVFQRFRRVGWLAQWQDGKRHAYAPQPGSEAGVERFFAACG